ncbi:MAG: succinate dehydrogenase cytochrome b subunit [Bdellovibrionales bacterium]|nr:succinate dehydrogenase cytochrome b subunit [Bdellovibrionales bacterium]
MGASGMALVLFLVVHLLGNLTLYAPNGDLINTYAARLQGLGIGLVALEVGLALTILLHIFTAIQVTYTSKLARPIDYLSPKTKGGPSKNTVGSRNMIITGIVLGAFLVVHILQFRFGPSMEEGYTTTVNGVMVHDLYRVVVEAFVQPLWVAFYVGCMTFLGFHLRHGYWSAFQSLGIINPRWSKPIHTLGLLLALLLAFGFLFIPIFIYFTQSGGGNP